MTKARNKKGKGNDKTETETKAEAATPRRRQGRVRPTTTPEKIDNKKPRQDKNKYAKKGNEVAQSDAASQLRKKGETTEEKPLTNIPIDEFDDKLTSTGEENISKTGSMEDDASVATAAVKNSQTEEDLKEGEWLQVPIRNPYKQAALARTLPAPRQHGFVSQWRGNFCIKIEAAETRAETEENLHEAINKLVKIMVDAKANLLPWKEKNFEARHMVDQVTFEDFQNLPFHEMRKLYLDSAFYTAKSKVVYAYLYWGLPRKYERFRASVENQLKEVGIIWYVRTLQAENRYPLGFIKGSHQKTDLAQLEERIHKATNLKVVARWRLWSLPKNLRPEGVTDDKVFAIGLETDQRYTAIERRLAYRCFGTNEEYRQEIELAIGTTIEIQLIPEKINGMNDIAKKSAVTQRAMQREINKELREATMYNTILGTINDTLHHESGITFRDLIMTTTLPNSNRYLFVSVDQAAGQDSPTLTFINGLQDQVQRFIEGACLTMEKNAVKTFGIKLDLKKKFTVGANSNFDEQEFDDETGQITTAEDKLLMDLGKQKVFIDWKDYIGNPVDPGKWKTDEQMDEASMASRLDDQSYQTQYTQETVYPMNEVTFTNEGLQDKKMQYTAADDRESGASASQT
jgi:hypothetical protein